jgi:hypothetical protein
MASSRDIGVQLDGAGKQDAAGAAIAVLVDDNSIAGWME